MTDLSFWVGVIANVISVLLFLSPIDTFCQIVRNKTTREFKSLPYICTLLNTAVWAYYGIIKPNSILVATINIFGIVVETIYLVLFLIYEPSEARGKTVWLIVSLDVVFLGAVVSVAEILLAGETRIYMIGAVGAALTIIMYASPLAAMETVVRTKSVKYMPFLLSLFCFFNGGIWTFYAILVKDYFIGVPNVIGFFLGTLQLLLYHIYCNNRRNSDEVILLEGGSQNETLIS